MMLKTLIFSLSLIVLPQALLGQEFCDHNAPLSFKKTRDLMLRALAAHEGTCHEKEESLRKLKKVDLSQQGIQDPSPLRVLEQVEDLNLSNNKIENPHIVFNLAHLSSLNLSHNPIKKLRVRSLSNIKTLLLDFLGGAKRIGGMRNLSSLKDLSFRGNKLSSLKVFNEIPQSLESLDVTHNPLTDAESVINLANKVNLNFFLNDHICKSRKVKDNYGIQQGCVQLKKIKSQKSIKVGNAQ
ncbi:leucine-rich repeat domain-containing protein [Pseudobacteriovorax antillogorgiicola]|uniref:Leucine Rich repeat-containing protein n=1 Tax=Pseudobacteriovorax antillogorgiicola TaxID=1513793 RepID=A0A1Y6BAE7_9BACT|nr:leucine-rich repeat domain-containing protein [Pseudobacteriovorax antillogorgiicola]TCS57533.1 leucine rich repeat (LRR) protein [Pseudobacteriovorax antillogorgiicola]SMF00002.1 Leucine Rich repeat-containing protein [Pseudobacteriovorax antillogorgiicola]